MVSKEMLKEYIKFYELAEQTIKDPALIPHKTKEQIMKDCIHYRFDGPWLMFVPDDETKITMQSSDKPNIYLFSDGEELELGLCFSNTKATDRFENIIHSLQCDKKEELKKKLGELPAEYITRVEKKLKTNPRGTPKYEIMRHYNAKELNDNKFDEIIEQIKQIRELGKLKPIGRYNYPSETPSFNLACIRILKNNQQKFVEEIIRLFDLLQICLEIKNERRINDMEVDNLIKQIKEIPRWFDNIKDPKDNHFLFEKLNPKPEEEVFKKAIRKIKKSEEFQRIYGEHNRE